MRIINVQKYIYHGLILKLDSWQSVERKWYRKLKKTIQSKENITRLSLERPANSCILTTFRFRSGGFSCISDLNKSSFFSVRKTWQDQDLFLPLIGQQHYTIMDLSRKETLMFIAVSLRDWNIYRPQIKDKLFFKYARKAWTWCLIRDGFWIMTFSGREQ